jgi:hypothetical protein
MKLFLLEKSIINAEINYFITPFFFSTRIQ